MVCAVCLSTFLSCLIPILFLHYVILIILQNAHSCKLSFGCCIMMGSTCSYCSPIVNEQLLSVSAVASDL